MQITTTSTRIIVKSEYHPDFPKRAKNLGGKWDATQKTWSFDLRDRERVLSILRDIFGADGIEPTTDIVTLRITVPVGEYWYSPHGESLFCAGRLVARAYGRDSGARLGEGIVLTEGFARSNGSRANWYTEIKGPAVVEIRDVPRAAATRAIADLSICLVGEIVGEAAIETRADGDNIVRFNSKIGN